MPLANQVHTTIIALSEATSTTAAALNAGVSRPISELIVQNDPDNTVDILVGSATVQLIQLQPGETLSMGVDDPSKVYVKSVSSTPTVNWLALGDG